MGPLFSVLRQLINIMQRYIKRMVNDMHKATWNFKPPDNLWEESQADPDNELELEDMSFDEQYIEVELQSIAQITVINPEQLPSAEKLTTEQQPLLATKLERLLLYFHYVVDFPAKFSSHLRYPFIRDFWNEEHVPLSFGKPYRILRV